VNRESGQHHAGERATGDALDFAVEHALQFVGVLDADVPVGFGVIDGSEVAEKALRYALEVHGDVEITVLTVVVEPSAMFGEATAIALAEDPEQSAADLARPVLERAREIAAEHGASVDTAVGAGHPAREILDRAGEYDTVLIGSHGGSLADRLFVGKIARRSPVPVTVVR